MGSNASARIVLYVLDDSRSLRAFKLRYSFVDTNLCAFSTAFVRDLHLSYAEG